MHDVEAKFHTPLKSIEFATNTGAVIDKCIAALPPLDTNVYFITVTMNCTKTRLMKQLHQEPEMLHAVITRDAFKASLAVHPRGGRLQARLVP